jgi:Plasmid encoded RepA protein
LHLWFHHDKPATAPASSAENLIVLSETFYDEIDQHRIPVEREVIALLANAPGVLDLYAWLVWKTWTLNGQAFAFLCSVQAVCQSNLAPSTIWPTVSFDEKFAAGLVKSRPFGPSARPASRETARISYFTPPNETRPSLQ